MKIVAIHWVDSKVTDLHQVDDEELPKPCEIVSVGFLIDKTREYIVIAREQIDEDWRGVLTVPRCCIRKVDIITMGGVE